MTVWTRQHRSMLRQLEQTGRMIAKKQNIQKDLQEHAGLVLIAYDWLVAHCPIAPIKPVDVSYPIWLSPSQSATMVPSDTEVVLELEIDETLMAKVNVAKWGAILNYSYIPKDEMDAAAHRKQMTERGLSDQMVFLSPFYPELRQAIMASWSRLFDEEIKLGSDAYYGIIWEVKQAWVKQIV